MTDLVTRLGGKLRVRWSALLQRAAGRYYDPSMDYLAAFFGIALVLALNSVRSNYGGARGYLVAWGVSVVGFGWLYIQAERRWRA